MKNLIFLAPLFFFSCADSIDETPSKNIVLTENIQHSLKNEFNDGNEVFLAIKEISEYNTENKILCDRSTVIKVNKIEEKLIDQIKLLDQVKMELLTSSGIDKSTLEKVCKMENLNRSSSEPLLINLGNIPTEFLRSSVNNPMGIRDYVIDEKGRGSELFKKTNLLAKELSELIDSDYQSGEEFEFEMIDNFSDLKDLSERVNNMLIENPLSNNTGLIRDIYLTLAKSKGTTEVEGDNNWIEENFRNTDVLTALTQLTLMQDDILRLRTKIYNQMNRPDASFNFDAISVVATGPDEIKPGESSEVRVQVIAHNRKINNIKYENANVPLKSNSDGSATIAVKDQNGKAINLKGYVTVYNSYGIPKTVPWSKTIRVEGR